MELQSARKDAVETLHWISENISGVKIPDLPKEKRLQLALPCLHAAIRHQQAVVLLVDDELFGSALALVRVVVEAFARGLWLATEATDAEVDAAGRDDFPGFSAITRALEVDGDNALTMIRRHAWSVFCSYTHTGYQQIGARLTASGVDENFQSTEISQALFVASFCALASAALIAELADDRGLLDAAVGRLRDVLQS